MPRGITKPDWDRVEQLAWSVVKSSEAGDDALNASVVNELIQYLQDMRQKYGDHPSILSTIGDYLDDPDERMTYYEKALTQARLHGDKAEEEETLDSIKHLKEIS